MGLNSGSELIVILMFLVTAEVMNASGMSLRLIAFAASLVGHLRGGMAYVCAADLAGRLGHLRLGPGRRRDHDPAAGAGDGARGLPARRGRRGRGRRLDQGGDRAAVGHVHRLRLARHRREGQRAAAVGPVGGDPAAGLPDGDGLRRRAPDGHAGQAPLRRLGDGRTHRLAGAAGAADPVHHPRRHLQRRLHPDRVGLGGGAGRDRAGAVRLRRHVPARAAARADPGRASRPAS